MTLMETFFSIENGNWPFLVAFVCVRHGNWIFYDIQNGISARIIDSLNLVAIQIAHYK